MDISLKQQLEEAGYEGEFTLDSLVEACGSKFDYLKRDGKNFWGANKKLQYNENINKAECFWAKTPTEAVARLWLELNKK